MRSAICPCTPIEKSHRAGPLGIRGCPFERKGCGERRGRGEGAGVFLKPTGLSEGMMRGGIEVKAQHDRSAEGLH